MRLLLLVDRLYIRMRDLSGGRSVCIMSPGIIIFDTALMDHAVASVNVV